MALTNAYLKKVYEDLSSRCANEKEFLQAVEEVFESLEPVVEKHPEYEDVLLASGEGDEAAAPEACALPKHKPLKN